MCTVLFLQGPPGHLILAGNRDEMRTRDRALPPMIDERGQYQLIYPVDATAGGTWIGANTHGMVATLLNHYQDAQSFQPLAPIQTRGELVREVLQSATLDAARDILLATRAQLPHIRPFILAVAKLDDDGIMQGWQAHWDGQALHHDPFDSPNLIISSSVRLKEATQKRTEQLRDVQWHEDNEVIHKAFAQDDGQATFATVCMSREDARTVSHTLIRVTPKHLQMTYFDGPPNQAPTRHEVTEALRTT